MKQILFVDDEPHVLEGLQRMLYPLRREWRMSFVNSGSEALQLLASTPVDALVTDVRMPGMSGTELLDTVVKTHPQVLRMVLSGTADHDVTLQAVLLAHQYLVKPCDPKTLRERLNRAFSLRYLLADESLRRLVSSIHSLPSTPEAYARLIAALRSPHPSEPEIGRVVAGDMAMTAKVLQLANSCFFGVDRPITDPREAVACLGVESVKSLALSLSVFARFDHVTFRRFSPVALQNHSTQVAAVARKIAIGMKFAEPAVQCACSAALLHDIGKLVLAAYRPADYDAALECAAERNITVSEAEQEVFGTTHAEVGAFLLWLWGLPDALIEAVASHHRVAANQSVSPAAPVRCADAIVNLQSNLRRESTPPGPLADELFRWNNLYRDTSVGE